MAASTSNRARVGDAFELLAAGLEPFVARVMAKVYPGDGADWAAEFARRGSRPTAEYSTSDPSFLLNVVIEAWDHFARQLPRATRNMAFNLRSIRNDWAHNKPFKQRDAQRALLEIIALLEAVDAPQVDGVQASLDELNRAEYAQQVERSGAQASNVVDGPVRNLQPWRQVITPHRDVVDGTFNVAEFAADLELVRTGSASSEYGDPRLFFDRTFLTDGLRQLLALAVDRLGGRGGQPVINCQTNFGGGKTHSLIALYHLFSGLPLADLPTEVQAIVSAAGLDALPAVNRAVVVGNRFGAGDTHPKTDGIVVNTIWGEIAWQLGGPTAYRIVEAADVNRTNPGDRLREVFAEFGPCLVLIDEWVAYARELYGRDDLPGGSFDSQFSFAQALTESARATAGCLFVVSIPASEGVDDPSDESGVSSLEVGGAAGREALRRLSHVVARQAEHWQPARGDESFEIVRRRLFEPLQGERESDRDAAAEAFGQMYRANRGDFPSEATEVRYVERIKRAYPVHPELFDRLYQDWSTVDRFQRTRGVLRLMAEVVHALWRSDDQSPLILPCSVPLDHPKVNGELTGKLDDHWRPVIDADIDGPEAKPGQIDRANPHLGAHHATRRVARTIFLGATPTLRSANRGLEFERISLGSLFPGERAALVADAVRHLSAQAPHLYVDRNRYWFDLQENVNRTARDEAERLLAGDRHEVHDEIVRRLRAQRGEGEFRRVHAAPASSDDVADDSSARLVVLGPSHPHIAKAEQSPALQAASSTLERRGNTPRQYRNMLVFAAAEQRALDSLEDATADHLAWSSISARVEELNLDAHQTNQARTRRQQTDDAVDLRLAEAYQYALVPLQKEPTGPIGFDAVRLDSQGTVAQRVSRKLISDGSLATQFPPVMLRLRLNNELETVWDEGHVRLGDLWEHFAKYLYLPRLRDQEVLVATAEQGPASMTWQSEGFAVAAGVDERTGRYLDLTTGSIPRHLTLSSLVVRPDFALGQLEAEATEAAVTGPAEVRRDLVDGNHSERTGQPGATDDHRPPTRFVGSVSLDPTRSIRQFGDVGQELIAHLSAQPGAEVTVRVEIVAERTEGWDDGVVRTVTENARTLGFDDGAGFEG